MDLANNVGYEDLMIAVKKWKEIFVNGINHPNELDCKHPENLSWEDIIFKGKLDAIDICLLTDEAMSKIGPFNDNAKYFLSGLPYFDEVIGLIPTLIFHGDYGGADLPNGDKIAFLPGDLEGGGKVIRTYLKLEKAFNFDSDILVLMDNAVLIVRYVEDFPEEYYEKRSAYESNREKTEIPNNSEELPF